MRWLLALPFRAVAALLLLVSKGASNSANVVLSIASFIDPQE